MKKEEVRVGATYAMKVSGNVVPVRITEEKWSGDKHTGWTGVNTRTNRPVCIKSAQKLRPEVGANPPSPPGHSEQGGPEPSGHPMPGEREGAGELAGVAGPSAGAASRKAKDGRKAAAKAPKAAKPHREPKPKKLSGLDAAAAVLKKAGKPMNFKDITEAALALGWKTSGKTPQATLYAAAIREIAAKGKEARFRKTERGMFEHTGVAEGA